MQRFPVYPLPSPHTWKLKLAAQSCPTLCKSTDCSLSGFSVHGIIQARELEWAAISFSRGSSWPEDQTRVSCTAGRFLPTEPLGKPPHTWLPRYQHLHQSVTFVSADEPSGTYHNHSESIAQHIMVLSWCCPFHKLGQMYQHVYIMIKYFALPQALSVLLLLRRHFL